MCNVEPLLCVRCCALLFTAVCGVGLRSDGGSRVLVPERAHDVDAEKAEGRSNSSSSSSRQQQHHTARTNRKIEFSAICKCKRHRGIRFFSPGYICFANFQGIVDNMCG